MEGGTAPISRSVKIRTSIPIKSNQDVDGILMWDGTKAEGHWDNELALSYFQSNVFGQISSCHSD